MLTLTQNEEQKVLLNLSRARKILEMTQDPPSDELIKQTLLTDIELVSANDLLTEIQKQFGTQVAKQFMDLVTKGNKPSDTAPLKQFFAGRKDIISRNCLSTLEK